MNFKELMIDKLKANVANRIANDATVIREVASAVIDEIDYTELVSVLEIRNSDIAAEIDHSDVLADIVDNLDMDDIKQAVAEKCDVQQIAAKVVSMLPDDFLDDVAEKVADEIVREMACQI